MQLDVTTPGVFLVSIIIFFLAILFRYFLAAGVFFMYYYVWKKEQFRLQRLSKRARKNGQIRREIIWSIKSSAIFAAVGAGTYWLWQQGYTAIYLDWSHYGYWYVPLSLGIILLLHETYYYWVHRWMHHPKVYRVVHKVHHDSLTPTPFTAFSFHPWESLIEALILPLILLVVPVHVGVLGLYLVIMTLSSVINHLDIEIYPQAFLNSKAGKFFIGATHHHHHHAQFKTNYGLYFTFWDRLMGTQAREN